MMVIELVGEHITLTPIVDTHFDALQSIILANPDVYRYTTIGATKPAFARWFTKAQTENAWTVIRQSDNQPTGSTRLYQINKAVGMVTVGYTWYAPEVRGKGINDEVKLLLLTHVFETLKVNRVAFEIHADNVASRKAVEKLGAQLEGMLRQSRRAADGQLGDTAMYALLAADWVKTKTYLQEKVQK